MKSFFVYMLECRDHSFYVGHTDDLETRVAQHQSGTFCGHTSARRPVRLVWHQELATREEALRAELQLKGWSRGKKRALIGGDWALLKQLARGPDRAERRRRLALAQGSSFDSGPAFGGPYAQDERKVLPERTDRTGVQDDSVRPARSGREAAAESKGATRNPGGTHA